MATKAQLALYRHEYETTPISIGLLCEKYNISIEEIPNHNTWKKIAGMGTLLEDTSILQDEPEDTNPQLEETNEPEEETDFPEANDQQEIVEDSKETLDEIDVCIETQKILDLTPQHVDEPTDLSIYKQAKLDVPEIPKEVIEAATVPTDVLPPEKPDDSDFSKLITRIDIFNEKMVNQCLSFIEFDATDLEIKELKDLSAIVSDIDKRVRPKDDAPTVQVHVLIQNMMAEVKDDC